MLTLLDLLRINDAEDVDSSGLADGKILSWDDASQKYVVIDIPEHTTKADKVAGATVGNFAGLDGSGNLTDSGFVFSDFATLIHNHDTDYSDISHTHAINELSDVTIASPVAGHHLEYNGSGWINAAPSVGGSGDLLADGTIPLTANWDAGAFIITALRFVSDVAGGTAPLTVASTTVVANLNADLLDGNEAAVFAKAASNITDKALVRGDGGVKGVQETGLTVDDNDKLNFVSVKSVPVTTADGTTVTFDCNLARDFEVTLAGDRILALSNISPGQHIHLMLTQDVTGSRTVTWFAGITWMTNSNAVPTLTTTASKEDMIHIYCKSSGVYRAWHLGSTG